MSVYVASDAELSALCEKTLAVHGNPALGGLAGEKIADLFRAIRIAQHAAYAYSYREAIDLPEVEFPTSATPQATLSFKQLYEDLGQLAYNTVDQHGYRWLPEDMRQLLEHVRICTAAKAARF